MSTVRKLPDDHPYVRQFTASVVDYVTTDGRRVLEVRYRDFAGVKQEVAFPSIAYARDYAERLAAGPHMVWDDELGGETFEDLTEFWARVAARSEAAG